MDPRNTYLSKAKRVLHGSTSGTGTASSVLDKGWLVAPRCTSEYKLGVNNFIQFAMTNSERNNRILCPCKTCGNRYWLAQKQVNEHLICEGFMNGYSTWIFHGETPGMVDISDGSDGSDGPSAEEEFADTDEMSQMLMDGFGMYDNTNLGENEEDDEDSEEEDVDAEGYAHLVNDGGRELYTGCKSFSKLHFLVRMMNIKKNRRVSNCIFDDYLSLFREALPEGHNLPRNFYEAKKYIRKIGLGYDTVHACKNDCVLFRGMHANADECPKCHVSRWKSSKPGIDGKRINKVPQKVARHFKLKKRIQRLFSSSDLAPNMRWHAEGRTKDGMLRHPADSPAWKSFDVLHKTFAAEPRNIRFGLATDGFNPFKTMNLRYSIWPILLIPYNLPPWICLKQSNIILSVIVPGRKAPGKEMDVYMQLVIDELLELWKHGVLTHDASFGHKFRLYAALLWTISDWQGRGIISGESTSACSHCLVQTSSRKLKHGKKTCFMGHRRFLSPNHEFRQDAESFDGTVEIRDPPVQLTGKEISKLTKHIVTDYGKLQKPKKPDKKRKRIVDDEGVQTEGAEDIGEYVHTVETTFRKRSVFFQLPYWKRLLVRHNLDAMHIEKNVFDNIVHTILDVDKKSKDSVNARLDLKQLKIRKSLHADLTGPKPVIPKAVYYVPPNMKKIFCKLIGDTRFPDGHASNLEHRVENGKISGLKSHDCHIIMQELLPLAMSRTLPESVTRPLMRLCNYFKLVYGKVINVKEMQMMEEQIPEILCQLEKIFPPAFFDIMVHLTTHLATEVRLAGPVQYRAMWFTERYMGKMKGFVNCRSHPEGAIAEGYVFDESLTFCSRYLKGCNTVFNRLTRHEDNNGLMKDKYLTILGRPMSASATTQLELTTWTQAQRCVLFNYPQISTYEQEHLNYLSAAKKCSKRALANSHHSYFLDWFVKHVQSLAAQGTTLNTEVELISRRPYMMVKKYNSYCINGCTFHTYRYGKGKATQCYGVTTIAATPSFSSAKDKHPVVGDVAYYGRIIDIIELNYSNQGYAVLFKCDWVKQAGFRVDEFGLPQVNFKHIYNTEDLLSEPFILASQANQVYYVEDPTDTDWQFVVTPSPRDLFDMTFVNDGPQ